MVHGGRAEHSREETQLQELNLLPSRLQELQPLTFQSLITLQQVLLWDKTFQVYSVSAPWRSAIFSNGKFVLNQHSSVQMEKIQDTIHFCSADLKEVVSREHLLRLPSWGHLLFLKVPGLDVIIAMMRNSIVSFRDVWINDRANKWTSPGSRDNFK